MTKTFCAFSFAASESVPTRTWRRDYNRSVANKDIIISRDQNVRFPCGNCNSVFSMKHNLQYHWRIECGQPPRYNCPYCVYRTKHPSNVRAHVRRIHPGSRVYVVDIRKTDIPQFSWIPYSLNSIYCWRILLLIRLCGDVWRCSYKVSKDSKAYFQKDPVSLLYILSKFIFRLLRILCAIKMKCPESYFRNVKRILVLYTQQTW